MVNVEVTSGDFTLLLEVDSDTLQHFTINGESSNAREYLLELMSTGHLDTSIWDERRLRGQLLVHIPTLDLQYILNCDEENESVAGESPDQGTQNTTEPTAVPFVWTHNAVLFLISLYKENKENFKKQTIRNIKIWQEMSVKLKANGFGSPTPKQVEHKWKNLRKSYSKVVDNRGPQSSGAGALSFQYFDEFQEIYATNPSYNPPTIASSSSMQLPNLPEVEDLPSSSHERPRKKQKTVDFIADLIKEQGKRQDQIIKELQNATNVFAEKLNQLIDKL